METALYTLLYVVLGVVGFLLYCFLYLLVSAVFPGLLRPVWWLFLHGNNRMRVYHRERVPATGPVLIVANHACYIDWMILWVSCPRRPHFVSWAGYQKSWILSFFFWVVRSRMIHIDSRDNSPRSIGKSLKGIAARLAAGEVVIMFPEGRLTRNGQMRPFFRGIETVCKWAKVPVTVVPAATWNIWGTLLSHKGGKMVWRWPEEFRRRIAVGFGHPMPGTSTVAEVRAAVVETLAEVGTLQSDYAIPSHAAFVRRGAKWRNLRKIGFVDASSGTDRALTWAKGLVGAWCLAKYLKSRVGPGQNVGVWLPTGLGSAFANFALAFLRKTSVNLNYTAGTEAVRSAARQTDMKVVLTAKRFLDRMPLDLPDDIQRIYLEDALAAIPGRWKLARMLAVVLLPGWFLDRFVLRCRAFKLDDPFTIIFSSGSTGEPKGVTLSLRNICSNGDSFQKGVNFTTDDRMLCTLPNFHSFGYTVCLWAPAAIGMMSVYYPDPRAAKEVGELCKRWQCSIALGTATFLRFFLRRCQPDDFHSLRLWVCGAEKLPVSLAEEFQTKFGVLPYEGYGCTELSPVVSANLPDSTVKGVTQVANKFGTVGQPLPGIVAKAFDPETFVPRPPETEGVLCVAGPNVMIGYWRQPEKTADVIRGGWYCTGDMGFVDGDGFIHITGRLSRFAKIAGEMVPLEKVEEELHIVLATNGDRALALAAVPDPKRGERVLVLHLSEYADKLPAALDALRAKGLPNLWLPDLRDCHPVEAFPVLGSGKLDLRGLGELAKAIAG